MSNDEKIKALGIGYKQISIELQHTEDIEHKATITVSSLVILLAGLVAQSEKDPTWTVRIALATFCVIFAGLAAYFIQMNKGRKLLLFRDLLRVEEILGFFEPGNYVSKEFIDEQPEPVFSEPTVFDTKGLQSGKTDVNRSAAAHTWAVSLTGVLAAVIVLSP